MRSLRGRCMVALVASLLLLGLFSARPFDRAADEDAQELDSVIAPQAPPAAPPERVVPQILGEIDSVSVIDDMATVRGWAVDPDDDRVLEVEVLVEGTRRSLTLANVFRPDIAAVFDVSENHGFVAEVPVSEDGSRVCVFTVPDGELVQCERVAGSNQTGVLITPTGVVTPIIEDRGDEWVVFTPCAQQAVVSRGKVVNTAQIVIDPGHGGRESSTVAFNGLMEKDVNLDVSLLLEDLLTEAGYSVVMTRTTDITMPIPTRTEIANTLNPDIFVSVHHNGGAIANLGRPGTGVYYQHDDPESRRLGGVLYEELYSTALDYPVNWVGTYLDGATSRLTTSGGDFYGIHRRTPNVTSVITEWLWMNNPAEAALLTRPEVLEAEALALFHGIDRWYRSSNEGSGFVSHFIDNYDSGGGGYAGCVDPVLE